MRKRGQDGKFIKNEENNFASSNLNKNQKKIRRNFSNLEIKSEPLTEFNNEDFKSKMELLEL
jgi:hypothetical protein